MGHFFGPILLLSTISSVAVSQYGALFRTNTIFGPILFPSVTVSQYGTLFWTILRGDFLDYSTGHFYRLFSSVAVSQYGALFRTNILSTIF